MQLGNFRKMRLVNLIVYLAFCLNLGLSGNALAFGKPEKASASMLRPESASQRIGDIVLNIAGNYTPEEIRGIQDATREYLIQAGKEGRIFRRRELKKQVDDYSAKRVKSGLPALSDKEKAALVAELEAEFVSHDRAIDSLTQEDVNDMFMPSLLFGGNWKERKDIATGQDARAKAREFKQKFFGLRLQGAVVVIFPEAKWIKAVAEELAGTNIIVGVQSKFFGDAKNPGDFEPERLQAKIEEAVARGARYANVGHSMHRLAGEGLSNEQANKIMKAILKDGRLIPWYTIEVSGEKDPNVEIAEGINIGLAGITKEQLATFPITPEPTALISTKEGTGVVDKSIQISAADTAQLSRLILKALKDKYGINIKVNAGYGASVKGDNAAAVFGNEEITNALIGGASLEAQAFFDTVQNGIKGKLTELASTIPTLEEVKQDLKKVDLAFVLDEKGKPSFFNKGEIGTAEHVAVTLSSSGFKYEGYQDVGIGMPARSIYAPFAMKQIYAEMAKRDPDAQRAYLLKQLRDYLEVSAKGAKLHRQERKEVADLINRFDRKAFAIWKQGEAIGVTTGQLIGFMRADESAFNALAGNAFNDFVNSVSASLKDEKPRVLAISTDFLKSAGVNTALSRVAQLGQLGKGVWIALYGENAEKSKTLFGDYNVLTTAPTAGRLTLELIKRGIDPADIVALDSEFHAQDDAFKSTGVRLITAKELGPVAVAKAVKELLGSVAADTAFSDFYAKVQEAGVISPEVYSATKEAMLAKLEKGIFELPNDLKPAQQVAEKIAADAATVSEFIDQI